MNNDQQSIIARLQEYYDECETQNCAEDELDNPPVVDSQQCHSYNFYNRLKLFAPDWCDSSKKLPDCLFINHVYDEPPVDERANHCIRMVELKSWPETDPYQPLLEKFTNCWNDLHSIIGNDPFYHLERPTIMINPNFPRYRELIDIVGREKLYMQHGKSFLIHIQEYDNSEITLIQDDPWST